MTMKQNSSQEIANVQRKRINIQREGNEESTVSFRVEEVQRQDVFKRV